MADSRALTQLQIDALREIGSIGSGNAATALSQIVNKAVDMGYPKILHMSRADMPDICPESSRLATVVLELLGEVKGHVLLTFDFRDALRLIGLLIGKDSQMSLDALSEIEVSAIEEVSSIITGSYLRVLASMINIVMNMHPPVYMLLTSMQLKDYVRNNCLRQDKDYTIGIKSSLRLSDKELDVSGSIVFIPSPESLMHLLAAIGVSE